MAYICNKKIHCNECEHYRYDEDYGGMSCFAQVDEHSNAKKNYMLISVCDREILTEQFDTLQEAHETMHREMVELGRVPEHIFDNVEYEDSDYGFGKWSAYANDGVNHADYDWLIVSL